MKYLKWRYSVTCIALAGGLAVVSCGGSSGGSGSTPPAAIPPATVLAPISGTVSLWAGSVKQAGVADGPIADAQFAGPVGVVQDSAGNIYTSDQPSHTIRKISVDGQVTTFAGLAGQEGSADGVGAAARFARPAGMAIDSAGFLYVADNNNHTIRKISPSGVVTTFAGASGQPGAVDAVGVAARFAFPTGLALAPNGDLYVADGNPSVRKITPSGTVTTFAGGGAGPVGTSVMGNGIAARFQGIGAITVDALGVVYVAEYGSGIIRKFNNLGEALPWGSAIDGLVQGLRYPAALGVQSSGDVLVVQSGIFTSGPNFSTNFSSIVKVTPAGTIQTYAGDDVSGSEDGPGNTARFRRPKGLNSSSNGSFIVADTENYAIRKLDASGIVSTVAGGSGLGSSEGLGAAARFFNPVGIAPSPDGGIYVADNSPPKVRKINSSGAVTTRTDSTGATGLGSRAVYQAASDSSGSLLIAGSAGTFGALIAAFDPQGAAIPWVSAGLIGLDASRVGHTFDKAGNYYSTIGVDVNIQSPSGAGRILATGFKRASALAADPQGTVFVADFEDHTIRAILADGTVVVKAGQSGVAGYNNGGATVSLLNAPSALAADDAGNVYFADASFTIRRLSPNGTVQLVAGDTGKSAVRLGALPGSLVGVKSLTWVAGSLYAVMLNSVIKITITAN